MIVAAVAFGLVARTSVGPMVALLPPQVGPDPKYRGFSAEEGRKLIADAITRRFLFEFDKSKLIFRDPDQCEAVMERLKLSRKILDKPAAFFENSAQTKSLAEGLSAESLVLVRLENWTQADGGIGEAASAGGIGASSTAVEVSLWVYNVQSGALAVSPSREFLRAKVSGPHFGTTDPSDMQGSPDDKVLVMKNAYRQRVFKLGEAVWKAVESTLKGQL